MHWWQHCNWPHRAEAQSKGGRRGSRPRSIARLVENLRMTEPISPKSWTKLTIRMTPKHEQLGQPPKKYPKIAAIDYWSSIPFFTTLYCATVGGWQRPFLPTQSGSPSDRRWWPSWSCTHPAAASLPRCAAAAARLPSTPRGSAGRCSWWRRRPGGAGAGPWSWGAPSWGRCIFWDEFFRQAGGFWDGKVDSCKKWGSEAAKKMGMITSNSWNMNLQCECFMVSCEPSFNQIWNQSKSQSLQGASTPPPKGRSWHRPRSQYSSFEDPRLLGSAPARPSAPQRQGLRGSLWRRCSAAA